jgi:Fe-S cluster biogenesis protein NfuA
MKFLINHDVLESGKVSFNDSSECEYVPLAAGILYLANVTQVHMFENVITVTQNGASDWEMLGGAVESIIEVELPTHNPAFVVAETQKAKVDRSNLSPELQNIEEIIDRTIRPGLQADGGDLEVVELDGNILTIRYEGACGGCPSAMLGTLEAIKNILRNEVNENIDVVAID